jgi:hypothetical protein
MKKERPLNKSEQKLFARIYVASKIHHSVVHLTGVSEAEEDGITAELDSIVDRLLNGHGTEASSPAIIEYIKSLRK